MAIEPKNGAEIVSFRVQARLTNRSLAIDLVSTLVEHVKNADDEFRHAITTAFGEAFNNVAIHGYRDRPDGVLDVEAELGDAHITLRLMDTGSSADLTVVPEPDLDLMVEGGMGVFMMRALVDEMDYRASVGGGSPNTLTLTKRMGR